MAELDLVCGPADPLPESAQSFRLLERLGSGGQADVYKAVRLSGGVSSAPVSVKVFRPDNTRPIEAQFRSWDKGDAVLMDLLGRGVPGICRRIDAFYGPPPHRPGSARADHLVPYQVLEYLPGKDLLQLLPDKQRPGIDAVAVLQTIAKALDAMHRPRSPEVHPTLHMDIKPSNVIISPSGEAKIIDFTGSRYSAPTHMTTISYTPEAAGPEAREGRVGPSYDVHGFGAVAFFLITGIQPRGETGQPGGGKPPVAALRSHPVVDADPRLRAHLMAPLSDDPRDRPATVELPRWIDHLASIMQQSRAPGLGVDWHPTHTSTVRVPAVSAHSEPATLPDVTRSTAKLPQTRRNEPATAMAAAAAGPGGPPPPPPDSGRFGRGVAQPVRPNRKVDNNPPPPPPRSDEPPGPPDDPPKPWTGTGGKLSALTSGIQLSLIGAGFAFVCWGIWAWSNYREGSFITQLFYFLLVLIVATGVFAMARALGTLVLVRWLKRERRSARLSHLATGIFLVIVGFEFLKGVRWLMEFWGWITGIF